jgi:LmbE family N-acetylglucosaminyl deacetylase
VQFRNVLVLAAHPDDEMGCAGTIARLADEGATIHLLTFSACMDLNPPSLLDEWAAAHDLLGVTSAQMLHFPNRSLDEHRRTILDVLDGRKEYDLILTPASFDEHQDHATVTREAIRAYKHSTILGYELPLNTVRESRLSAYVGLPGIDLKLAHAALYASQAHKPYMHPKYIEGLARVRGIQSGHFVAEAFEVVRWIL